MIDANDIRDIKSLLFHATHSLKTPLHGILGNSSLLMQELSASDSLEMAQDIYNSGNSLLDSINKLTDLFMAFNEDDLSISVTIDIVQLVDQIAKPISLESGKTISLTQICPSHKIRFNSLEHVKIILRNLIQNTAYFSSQNKINIELDTTTIREEEYLSIKIEDILETQSSNKLIETMSENKITDLKIQDVSSEVSFNIILCKMLLKNIGGHFTVQEKNNIKTTIELLIPALFLNNKNSFEEISIIEPKKKRALVLDDNKEVTKLLDLKLKHFGIEPYITNNPIEAIRLLKQLDEDQVHLDFIITDFLMSEINGIDFSKEIKSIKQYRNTPIILHTAINKDRFQDELDKGTINDFLTKPINIYELKLILSNILNEDFSAKKNHEHSLPSTGSPSKKYILVAEDNKINQKIVKKMIEKMEHECLIVNDGIEAINAIKSTDFDLVLMDIDMPRMNGIEATKSIRNLEDISRNIPIYALTANTDKRIYNEAMNSGMNGFLSKPFEPKDILDLILNQES